MRCRLGPISVLLLLAALVPVADLFLPPELALSEAVRTVCVYAILALGLNLVT